MKTLIPMRRMLVLLILTAISGTALIASGATPAHGALFAVTKQTDTNDGTCDSDCSLREAIIATNTAGGGGITVPQGTYTLNIAGSQEDAAATGDLDITSSVNIHGFNPATTIINGGQLDRVFDVRPGNYVEISGVTVKGGLSDAGGGVRNEGELNLHDSTVTDNFASVGGGIWNTGSQGLSLTNVSVGGNSAALLGGGIYNLSGFALLEQVTVAGNTVNSGGGGAIYSGASSGTTATVGVVDATISGNAAKGGTLPGKGGGILNGSGSSVGLSNVTISGNTAAVDGGGVSNGATVTATNVTITGNSAATGGGVTNSGTATLTNAIIASNGGGNCSGAMASGGHNLDDANTCGFAASGDLVNTNPLLGPLTDNGGPTQTHALQAASPAIDAGGFAPCSYFDQRGVARPQGAGCDIGAYEFETGGFLGYYHPVTPYRILDTRTTNGNHLGKVGQGEEVTVDVTGAGGIPPANVAAVVLNATVTEPTAPSYLTVYPSGVPRPLASNLNFGASQTVANLVTVKAGRDGNVKVYNAAGQTHVIFDIVGWYGEETDGSRFNALAPARILDTRTSPQGMPPGKLGENASVTVTVKGVGGVPDDAGVTAVAVNVTVTEPTADGYLTVYPSGGGVPPLASNLNFAAGETIPNFVVVRVGELDGKVKVYNCCGRTHVIFDVVGWYSTSSGELFHALTPSRILDTRSSPQGVPPGKVGSNAEITVQTGGVDDLAAPAGYGDVLVNTTVTEPTAPSYLTVYPSRIPRPLASNLNFDAGQTVPNLVAVRVGGDGKVKVYNTAGQTHVIFDAVGYFGP